MFYEFSSDFSTLAWGNVAKDERHRVGAELRRTGDDS
jgi:hypothetical protein